MNSNKRLLLNVFINLTHMKIIRPILITWWFLFAVNTLQSQVTKGEGVLKTDIRELTGFTEIIAQGRFDLVLVQGAQEGLRIESDDNLLELFQTRLEGNRLYINMNADIRKYSVLKVTVSFKELKSIVLLNEVSLSTTNVIHFDDIKFFSAGTSKINFEIFATSLALHLTDGSYTYFKGYAENLNIEMHDESELNAFDMPADKCQVLASGYSEVMIAVQKNLKLMVSGLSNVYYIGEPTITERIFSSNGFIVKRKRAE
jgi:hypothetical protein